MKIEFSGTLAEFLHLTDMLNKSCTVEVIVNGNTIKQNVVFTGLTETGKKKKIDSIKEIRNTFGIELKKAKDIVESNNEVVLGKVPSNGIPKLEYVNVKIV